MANFLSPIPSGVAITDQSGVITTFFRLRWEELRNKFAFSSSVANQAFTTSNAALVTTTLYTTLTSGMYRVSWYLRKTVTDGAGSSLQPTIGFLDLAQAETFVGPALVTDTNAAFQSGSQVIRCDANSDITAAVAYASTTPTFMQYEAVFIVEFIPA